MVVGLIVGGAGGYLTAASQVTAAKAETKEARDYQSDFAMENSKLASEKKDAGRANEANGKQQL